MAGEGGRRNRKIFLGPDSKTLFLFGVLARVCVTWKCRFIMQHAITPDTATGNKTAAEITDKKGYAQRWIFSVRKVDGLLAEGLPHLKIGARRVRIVIEEADRWMLEKYGTQRRDPARIRANGEKGGGA